MSSAELLQAIAHERTKIVTLGRVVEESLRRLDRLEAQLRRPAPATRKNRKNGRLVQIDQFYQKRKTKTS